MMILLCVLAAIGGYLIGSIPVGYLIGKAHGIDVRKSGSGNIGATNVLRVLGRNWGILVFFLDLLKGFLAVRIALWWGLALFRDGRTDPADFGWLPSTMAIAAGIGCILGHTFPLWLKFKGGKGVATSAGVLLGLVPTVAIVLALIWSLVFLASRYVSLASLVAAVLLPIGVWLQTRALDSRDWPIFYFSLAVALLVIIRHRSNIQRLIAGTENRFERHKS